MGGPASSGLRSTCFGPGRRSSAYVRTACAPASARIRKRVPTPAHPAPACAYTPATPPYGGPRPNRYIRAVRLRRLFGPVPFIDADGDLSPAMYGTGYSAFAQMNAMIDHLKIGGAYPSG